MKITLLLISPDFHNACPSEGNDLKDAIEMFKSSVWQQGWNPDEKIMKEYGDWMVYEKAADFSLSYQGKMKDLE